MAQVEKRPNDIPGNVPSDPILMTAVEQALHTLAENCPIRRALAAETNGQVIASLGIDNPAELEGLAALVAGYMAAGQAILNLSGSQINDQLILNEGQDSFTFLFQAGEHLILYVQVKKDVPLGWARLKVQDAGQQMAGLIAEFDSQPVPEDQDWPLDDLSDEFGEALDFMWKDPE